MNPVGMVTHRFIIGQVETHQINYWLLFLLDLLGQNSIPGKPLSQIDTLLELRGKVDKGAKLNSVFFPPPCNEA